MVGWLVGSATNFLARWYPQFCRRVLTSFFQLVLHAVRGAPMCDCDGLLVPSPAHAAGHSHEGRALAWTLIIESGHINSHEARHLQP